MKEKIKKGETVTRTASFMPKGHRRAMKKAVIVGVYKNHYCVRYIDSGIVECFKYEK